MNKIKVSVLASVYNGSLYLTKLLESIQRQVRQPDEVIIVDDASSDDTVYLTERFIEGHSLKNWKLIKNTENKGWKRNFMYGLENVCGDIIFFCDQDDIWHPDKIEKMTRVMEHDQNILVLASDYIKFTDIEPSATVKEMSDSDLFALVERKKFSHDYIKILRPGCVMCIRSDLKKYAERYWFAEYPHDAFFWRIADLLDGLYLLRYPTIDYRRHGLTATGRDRATRKGKLRECGYYLKMLRNSIQFCKEAAMTDKIKILEKAVEWCRLRETLLSRFKWAAVFHLLYYLRFYYKPGNYLSDIYLSLTGQDEAEKV